MAVKILMGVICVIPVMLIMYGVMYFEGKRKGNILFGVTLWSDNLGSAENEELERLQKTYRKQLMLMNLIVIAGFILCCIPKRDSIYMSGFMLLIMVMIVIYFLPFISANRKLTEMKNRERPLSDENSQKELMTVDIKAASYKQPVMFVKTGALGMLAGIIPFILEIFTGKADDLKGVNLLITGTFGLIGIMFFAMSIYFCKTRTEVLSSDSNINMQIARVRRYQWSRACAAFIWINTAYTFYIWLKLADITVGTAEIIIVSFIYVAALLLVMVIAHIKVVKVQNKYCASAADGNDEDKYWLYGLVYYNKNDSRLMVNKRVGIGTTINMAKPAGKVIMGICLIVLAVSLVGSSVWSLLVDFTPVRLELTDSYLTASQLSEEYKISLSSITGAELLDELPDMSKRVGTGMEAIYKGSFVEKEGEMKKCEVCVRIKDGPYIRISTDTGIYYLNDEEAEKTVSIYEELASYQNNK